MQFAFNTQTVPFNEYPAAHVVHWLLLVQDAQFVSHALQTPFKLKYPAFQEVWQASLDPVFWDTFPVIHWLQDVAEDHDAQLDKQLEHIFVTPSISKVE